MTQVPDDMPGTPIPGSDEEWGMSLDGATAFAKVLTAAVAIAREEVK